MNRGNITIKDIARMAGVSKGTVDRVLHKRGRVSEASFRKVTKVLEEIDYKPNLIARTLSSSKNYRIGAVLPNPEGDQYWSQAREGFRQAESEWDHYNVTINPFFFDQNDKTSFKACTEEALSQRPDGIIAAPIFYDEALVWFESLRREQIPYVLFNTNIPEVKPLSFIGQDSLMSGRVGAELMYLGQPEGGKLAILHLDEDLQTSVHLLQKEQGFRQYFEDRNTLAFHIEEVSLRPGEPGFQEKLDRVLRDLDLRGVFVSTSKGTAVVAASLERLGKGRVRLVGYDILDDNLKFMRSGTIDFLINQNPKRQASLGVSHLANHLIFKKLAPELELFPLEVITQQNLESYLTSRIH